MCTFHVRHYVISIIDVLTITEEVTTNKVVKKEFVKIHFRLEFTI